MKNFRQLPTAICLLLSILGLSFLPAHGVFEKAPEDVTIELTIRVDTKNIDVHPDGIFLSCNILNSYSQTKMEQYSSTIWELTIDSPVGYEVLWKFLNGPDNYEPNTDLEVCAIDGGFTGLIRTYITGSVDEVMPTVCYGLCTDCALLGNRPESTLEEAISIFPNPATEEVLVKYEFDKMKPTTLQLYQSDGSFVRSLDLGNTSQGEYKLRLDGLAAGLYWLRFTVGEQWVSKNMVVGK